MISKFTRELLLTVFLAVTFFVQSNVEASLTINFNFDLTSNPYEPAGDVMLSAENQSIFTDAGSFWTTAITGYADGMSRSVTIHASAFSQAASMGSILLGSAGPRSGFGFSHAGESYVSTTDGSMRFNVHPDAVGMAGLLNPLTIRHEIGHVLGIGTWWNANGDYTDGTGQYTGANALAAYQNEFDPDATFVPVELEGGPGTANGHWNEGNAPSLTVLSGVNAGLNIDDALMTGTLSGAGFLSDTTLGSFRDMGLHNGSIQRDRRGGS